MIFYSNLYIIAFLNKGDLKMGKVETIFILDEILALYEIRKVVDVIFPEGTTITKGRGGIKGSYIRIRVQGKNANQYLSHGLLTSASMTIMDTLGKQLESALQPQFEKDGAILDIVCTYAGLNVDQFAAEYTLSFKPL